MYWGYKKPERTEHEKALEWELDEYRLREERASEERQREQDRRDRERREEHEEYMRSADNWIDALQKQIYLCRREVENIGDDTPPEDDFFEQSAQACELALKIWKEVENSKQIDIEELEAKIQAVKDSIRLEVADKVESAKSRSEYSGLADQIRKDDISNFLYW